MKGLQKISFLMICTVCLLTKTLEQAFWIARDKTPYIHKEMHQGIEKNKEKSQIF